MSFDEQKFTECVFNTFRVVLDQLIDEAKQPINSQKLSILREFSSTSQQFEIFGYDYTIQVKVQTNRPMSGGVNGARLSCFQEANAVNQQLVPTTAAPQPINSNAAPLALDWIDSVTPKFGSNSSTASAWSQTQANSQQVNQQLITSRKTYSRNPLIGGNFDYNSLPVLHPGDLVILEPTNNTGGDSTPSTNDMQEMDIESVINSATNSSSQQLSMEQTNFGGLSRPFTPHQPQTTVQLAIEMPQIIGTENLANSVSTESANSASGHAVNTAVQPTTPLSSIPVKVAPKLKPKEKPNWFIANLTAEIRNSIERLNSKHKLLDKNMKTVQYAILAMDKRFDITDYRIRAIEKALKLIADEGISGDSERKSLSRFLTEVNGYVQQKNLLLKESFFYHQLQLFLHYGIAMFDRDQSDRPAFKALASSGAKRFAFPKSLEPAMPNPAEEFVSPKEAAQVSRILFKN